MNSKIITLVLLCALILTGCLSLTGEEKTESLEFTSSPYINIAEREIRALSEERIQALLKGAGSGYALSAELNSYPGPLHALEFSSQLALTVEQEHKLQEIYNEMKKEAQEVGKKIVELETRFENSFRSGTITKSEIETMTNEIASLDGVLRSIHLVAHIDTTDIFSIEQIQLYDELRGYSSIEHNNDHENKH